MNPLSLLTDSYDRPARLYPALLLLAPVVCVFFLLTSQDLTVLRTITAITVSCGGAFLLSQLARDSGKKLEKKLFAQWGGLPSVAIFRHRDTRLNSITKSRYHSKLSKLVQGAKAPSPDQETADPNSADTIYGAWSDYIRINTRDVKKFPLLFRENINYGYRRNVFGLRWYGLLVCSICVLASAIQGYVQYRASQKIPLEVTTSMAILLLFVVLWFFRFTSSWVRIPADAYAERLAEATESLGGGEAPRTRTASKT